MLSMKTPSLRGRAGAVAMAALLLLVPTASVHAALLGVAPPFSPTPRTDIYSNFTDVIYTSGSTQFLAIGGAVSIDYDNLGSPDYDLVDDGISQLPDFKLDIRVSNSGVLLGGAPSANDLVITGAIDSDGSFDLSGAETFDTLLTAEIAPFGFGYAAASPFRTFDFYFTVTGGTQAAAFGGIGAQIGVVLDAVSWTTPFTGSFASNFNGGGLGNVDTFSTLDGGNIPEPSSWLLMLAGGLPLALRRAWKARPVN